MSTSMSQPNQRAECENVRDLFFWKQWNWGGLPAATSTALGLPYTACSNLSSPKTQHSQQHGLCQQKGGQQPSLGIPRCNILPKFLPLRALDVQTTNQEISQNMTLQHGKPQRKHNKLTSVKNWRWSSPDLTAQHLQADVNPTCLQTTSAHKHAENHTERSTEVAQLGYNPASQAGMLSTTVATPGPSYLTSCQGCTALTL